MRDQWSSDRQYDIMSCRHVKGIKVIVLLGSFSIDLCFTGHLLLIFKFQFKQINQICSNHSNFINQGYKISLANFVLIIVTSSNIFSSISVFSMVTSSKISSSMVCLQHLTDTIPMSMSLTCYDRVTDDLSLYDSIGVCVVTGQYYNYKCNCMRCNVCNITHVESHSVHSSIISIHIPAIK